jgi:putative membrane protein insertion efficiency factor
MKGSAGTSKTPGRAARAAMALVRSYQQWLSHLKPRTCRYYPSCSEYAVRAIGARGLIRGGLLAAWRVLRCNPFSAGGYDPGPWGEAEGLPTAVAGDKLLPNGGGR